MNPPASSPAATPSPAAARWIDALRGLPARHPSLRWGVLAAGLLLGPMAAYLYDLEQVAEAKADFRNVALEVGHDLDLRLRAYEDVLFALRGLFRSSKEVTRPDFHEFVAALTLRERYPGVTNLSFSRRVFDRGPFERAVRSEQRAAGRERPEFVIKPEGERAEYMVLDYIEPLDQNIAAWGLDLNADPKRRAAVERARDTGNVATTSGIKLVRDVGSTMASTLLRLAVYHGNVVPESVEERRRLFAGVVGSTIRVGEMVTVAFPPQVLARLRVVLRDDDDRNGETGAPEAGMLLYDSAAHVPGRGDNAPYAVTQRLRIGDRGWRLQVTPIADPLPAPRRVALAALVAGAFVAGSLLLFALMGSLAVAESRGRHLADTQLRLKMALDGSQLATWDWDIAARRVFHGEQWSLMLGGPRLETQNSVGELAALLHPDDAPTVRRGLRRLLRGETTHYAAEHRVRKPSGEWLWIRSRGQVVARASDGRALRVIGTNGDIGARKQSEFNLAHRATHDVLTGLPNRGIFWDRLEQAVERSRRSRDLMGVMYVDIDKFKPINDTFGHAAGDAVLKEFALRLAASVRATDTIARLGGDEFALVLESLASREDGLRIASQIVAAMRRPFSLDGAVASVSVSVGIAFHDGASQVEPARLMEAADRALYEMKAAGRDGLRVAA